MKSILNDSPYQELNGYHDEVDRIFATINMTNKKVLDVGCGFGWSIIKVLKKGAKHVSGIDVDLDVLDIARKVKNKKASFKQGSAIDIPYKNQSFDIVVSWEVLEHVPVGTEFKMFSEVSRVLKKGGVFLLSTQHNHFFSTLLDPAWWLIGHRHYSTQAVKEFALKNGFKVNKLYVKGSYFSVLGVLNMYIAKWIFKREKFFKSFFERKLREEFAQKNGFYDLFLVCVKK